MHIVNSSGGNSLLNRFNLIIATSPFVFKFTTFFRDVVSDLGYSIRTQFSKVQRIEAQTGQNHVLDNSPKGPQETHSQLVDRNCAEIIRLIPHPYPELANALWMMGYLAVQF